MKPGEKLAMARRYHSPALTQRELANMLGVDTSSVGRWEATDTIPSLRVAAVAHAFNVEPAWFFDGEDVPPGASKSRQEAPNAREILTPRLQGVDGQSLLRGDEVLLPAWRGVMASDGECEFYESGEPEMIAIPSFLAGNDPDNHVLCIAGGASMYPRVKNGERVVVRLERNPPNNAIVIARRPDGANFVKVLRQNDKGLLELHSLNPAFNPIVKLDDWEMRGAAVAILHSYEPGQPNIEWDGGRFLKAP